MRDRGTIKKASPSAVRRSSNIVVTVAFALSLVAGLLVFVDLQAEAQTGPEAVDAELSVEKRANTDVARPGDLLTYTITLSKDGADPTPAWLTDSLPAELDYVEGSCGAADNLGQKIGTCGEASGVITWHVPNLAGSVWISYTTLISSAIEGEITNTVQITGAGTLVTDTWSTRVTSQTTYFAYFPLVLKRWPPVPYAPTLAPISNPDREDTYTVTWTYDYADPPVDSYVLEETKDGGVAQEEDVGTSTSRSFVDKDDGTYCYRVRGRNGYGLGPWSSSACVEVVTSYRDDFSDSGSGWRARRTSAPDIDNDMDVEYKSGRLITISDDDYDFGIFSPMADVPSIPYEIRMRTRVIHEAGMYVPSYGIVFGAQPGEFCPVERANAENEDGCFYHYYRLNVPVNVWGGHIEYGMKRIDEHVDRGKAEGKDLSDGYHNIDSVADWDGWNNWRIEVYESEFKLYVNGHHLDTYAHDRYVGDPLFGILTDNYESAPAKFEHEYFYVDPIR